MSFLSLDLSEDETTLTMRAGSDRSQLKASQVDDLIRRLAKHRARMKPVHPAEPPVDESTTLAGDNLLWCVRSAPQMSALELGIQHPGLGWIMLQLSRAQVEDLQTSLAFSLNDLQPVRPRPTP
ncbi:MAG: hypothetical protein GEU95_08335 [Rhizobiales bacterium]|nr:hypothetical protein [Hyphomicrobiales bacterium]